MEQIRSVDGRLYYGDFECRDASEAYMRFRDDYHKALGGKYYRRLNMPAREERIHGYGFDFTPEYSEELSRRFECYPTASNRIMGIVDISYCRLVTLDRLPKFTDEEYWKYMDWLFERGTGRLKTEGRDGSGRTNRNINKRYR